MPSLRNAQPRSRSRLPNADDIRTSSFILHPSSFPLAFTLIELLVVVSLIVLLIALLMPSLHHARLTAQRTACMSNMAQQHRAQVNYATDNAGAFPPRNENSPDYQRQVGATLNAVHLMRRIYMTPDVMICPLVSKVQTQPQGEYRRNDWLSGSYGGWETDAAYVYTSYMWMGGFNAAGGNINWLNGERPCPKRASENTPDRTFITHRLNYYSATSLHEISHGGRGLFQSAIPYDNYLTTDMPVTYADGHAIHRDRTEIQPRMTINGSYPGSPGFPGTYLW